eukprot:scaffold25_cov110-Isochrysis_galbana.AAC.2
MRRRGRDHRVVPGLVRGKTPRFRHREDRRQPPRGPRKPPAAPPLLKPTLRRLRAQLQRGERPPPERSPAAGSRLDCTHYARGKGHDEGPGSGEAAHTKSRRTLPRHARWPARRSTNH